MAKKFNMGDFAKTLAVSDSDTGREQIEYIDIDLLDADPSNFYSLNGLDELADNIATIGLQQPIRVRSGEGGHTVIVSGHRRAAAIRKLVEDGRNDLREVPCIRERGAASPALQELRLIYANSNTRAMTSAEISQQAEKVRELLYRLQEEGYEFPGRMRDHVAEACQISKSKLARLDAIRNNLAPDILTAYWDGTKGGLSEDVAYKLSQLPADVQRQVVDAYRAGSKGTDGLRYLYGSAVDAVRRGMDSLKDAPMPHCPDGAECDRRDGHLGNVIRAKVRNIYLWCDCEGGGCCVDCASLRDCKDVCPKVAGKQRELKQAAKEDKQREKLERELRERPAVERVASIWRRFSALRQKAGLSPEAYFERIGCQYSPLCTQAEDYEDGSRAFRPETDLPYGYSVSLTEIGRWRKAADALGCSVDYLMMRTDEPAGGTASWQTGEPPHGQPCDIVADFALDDYGAHTLRMACYWDGEALRHRQGANDAIGVSVVRWLALPEVEHD